MGLEPDQASYVFITLNPLSRFSISPEQPPLFYNHEKSGLLTAKKFLSVWMYQALKASSRVLPTNLFGVSSLFITTHLPNVWPVRSWELIVIITYPYVVGFRSDVLTGKAGTSCPFQER